MFKRANEDSLCAIQSLCKDNIIGTKILCYVTAYGFERSFLEVWTGEGEDGTVNTVLIKFYDDVTVIADDNADIEQLSVFIDMIGFNSVCLSEDLCIKLGFDKYVVKNGYCFSGDCGSFVAEPLKEDDMREAYKLISTEIPGSFEDSRDAYLSFLSDYTFRERRKLARGVCTHIDNTVSSVALTSSETENAAIISGVACNRNFKKTGLGKQVVLSLVRILKSENKNVYVIALNEAAEGFYEHLGFVMKEKISFIERNNDV